MPTSSLPLSLSSPLWALLALPLLLRILKSKASPSRERIIPPSEERVVLLGASSGVGKDLALAYASRGAKVCIVARRADALEKVKIQCLDLGVAEGDILVVPADITTTVDLIKVRETVESAWGGLDTLHILAGLPSTSILMELAGVKLNQQDLNSKNQNPSKAPLAFSSTGPDQKDLDKVASEARALSEVNYIGTVLALTCFLPLLASTSKSPALHHLSSVAATVPAPHRVIYAATKAAGLMAVESCRVECEGSGVRFFSFCPGTIDNEFRLKTSTSQTGGRDETKLPIKHKWGKLLLSPQKVVDIILYNLSLSPKPQPLIPYPPFSWMKSLNIPPKHLVHAPWQYRLAMMVRDTPIGWAYIEPGARRKYGLIGKP
ncbi:uncharacterized protein I303_106395 [Kwoniella dejecticola CBS 10117]|uniref:NAD(P)-binding protein n=1 Tax=Kwoniella dejecticola CBS 10117 TaxID=1296121 RepID=A0A1A5ZUU2_9TREE|nr:uncharacterized protein I303_08347 [Kwoniella dejecticola CBS 10117]OBR81576.1 hypothetical protein I303_08347 [Kwoniella dejecticola CBS 10117]